MKRIKTLFLFFSVLLVITSCKSTSNVTEYTKLTCSVAVRCDTVKDNLSLLSEEKADLLTDDFVILEKSGVPFSEGESVFDILYRTVREENIHMEFSETPMYKSIYIEGIGNLYEFDCGELSGWMYRVNGDFPGASCSEYYPQDGDVIEFLYTCDLGKDVGKEAAMQK